MDQFRFLSHKRILSIFCITVLMYLFSFTAAYGRDVITLNYPPDKTIMEFGLVNISLSLPEGSVDSIMAAVNGHELPEIIIPDSTYECFSVQLELGVNKIVVQAFKDDETVDTESINVFRRSDLESRYAKTPPGYREDHFHMAEHEACKGCHVLRPNDSDMKPVSITAFRSGNLADIVKSAPLSSTCYSCHKSITSYPFVHVPSAVWSCLSCHDPEADPVYAVRKPDTRMCFTCHLEQKELWYGRKVVHGPFNTGKCAICHNPHASEYSFNLIRSTWDLCVSCHINKGSGRHIVEGYFPGPDVFHPTRGKPDPLRLGKELSCASCHEPHASDAPKLWRLNVGSGFELCARCHAN